MDSDAKAAPFFRGGHDAMHGAPTPIGDPKRKGIATTPRNNTARRRRKEYDGDRVATGGKGAPRHGTGRIPATPRPLSHMADHSAHHATPQGPGLDAQELLGSKATPMSSSRYRASMAADELPRWVCGVGIGIAQRGLDKKIGDILGRVGAPGFCKSVRPPDRDHILIEFSSGADAERAMSLGRIDVGTLMQLGPSWQVSLALTTISDADREFLTTFGHFASDSHTRHTPARPWASQMGGSRMATASGIWGSTTAMSTPGMEGGSFLARDTIYAPRPTAGGVPQAVSGRGDSSSSYPDMASDLVTSPGLMGCMCRLWAVVVGR